MWNIEAGPSFSIEIDKFLKLNVINADDKDIKPSMINLSGEGELNIFDKDLTIKQEGNISSDIKQITIQPMNDQVSIFIDESVDTENENENEKVFQVRIFTNKNTNENLLKNFIETDDD